MPSGAAGPRRKVLSVCEVTGRLQHWLEGLPPVWVKGEASNVSVSPSGHMFFTLKDESARLDAILYRRAAMVYGQFLEEGVEVVISGAVSLYPPAGRLQIAASAVEPVGEGAARAALLRLKAKLEKAGLFAEERKIPLPLLPRKIALVTSPSGAAIQDMIRTIHGRFPPVDILVVPSRVQGEEAPFQLASAVQLADESRLADVIIIGRGGGSAEDLSAFNTETVVRAVADCHTPIVSAVGHEVDICLTDLAADRRALTPTDAGKMVVPDIQELREDMELATDRLAGGLRGHLKDNERQVLSLMARLKACSPRVLLKHSSRRMRTAACRLSSAARSLLRHKQSALEARTAALHARSPVAVLARGYSVTTLKGQKASLRDTTSVEPGSVLETILHKGTIISRVEETGDKVFAAGSGSSGSIDSGGRSE